MFPFIGLIGEIMTVLDFYCLFGCHNLIESSFS